MFWRHGVTTNNNTVILTTGRTSNPSICFMLNYRSSNTQQKFKPSQTHDTRLLGNCVKYVFVHTWGLQ
jgi:hypothetical protein